VGEREKGGGEGGSCKNGRRSANQKPKRLAALGLVGAIPWVSVRHLIGCTRQWAAVCTVCCMCAHLRLQDDLESKFMVLLFCTTAVCKNDE
jgi:hypothetical protein